MSVGEQVVAACAGGSVVVARAELARFTTMAIQRLKRGGRASRELAIVLDAASRSDDEFAAEVARLSVDERATIAEQIDSALELDRAELGSSASVPQLESLATELLSQLGAAAPDGTVVLQNIQNTGSGTVHAPGSVMGNYSVTIERPAP